jgi:hypothetical protein
MTYFNMNGCQSFIVHDIRNEMLEGREVTHILNVKVWNPGEGEVKRRIRAAIYERIANVPITKNVMGFQVTVTWKPTANVKMSYYFCNSRFSDDYVIGHTKALFKEIKKAIDEEFNKIFTTKIAGLAFFVTIPALESSPDPNGPHVIVIKKKDGDKAQVE